MVATGLHINNFLHIQKHFQFPFHFHSIFYFRCLNTSLNMLQYFKQSVNNVPKISYFKVLFLNPENHDQYHIFGLFFVIFRKRRFFVFSECDFLFFALLQQPAGSRQESTSICTTFLRKKACFKSTEIKTRLSIFIFAHYYLTVVRNLNFD